MLFISLLLFISTCEIGAWDSAEMELFDLMEDVNENFYEIMGIQQDVTGSELRKAYRRLSLQYHPDKNKDDEAEGKFRQIVAIYEVLKDPEKKQLYDNVLQNGLPTWRQPVYYYRRVRKMSLMELVIFLFILMTGGHYILAWSSYIEKKYELEEVFMSKFKKKMEKKLRKVKNCNNCPEEDDRLLAQINLLPKPSFQDLLPFKLCQYAVLLAKWAVLSFQEWQERRREMLEQMNAEDLSDSPSENQECRIRKPHRKKAYQLPEGSYECILDAIDAPDPNDLQIDSSKENSKAFQGTARWTEDDLVLLTKTINKFPGGTINRWEKIASVLGRSVTDVLAAAKKLKSSSLIVGVTVPTSVQGITGCSNSRHTDRNHGEIPAMVTMGLPSLMRHHSEDSDFSGFNQSAQDGFDIQITEKHSSIKIQRDCLDGKEDMTSSVDHWTQVQQRALELALMQFPKGVNERWERISSCVPDKSKEECILRYKYLVEAVKKKRHTMQKEGARANTRN